MATGQSRVIESSAKPQVVGSGGGTVYVAVPREFCREVGMDPRDPETIPDEVTPAFYKSGPRKGEFVIDFAEAVRDE
jgi:hypothetical protein